MFTGLVQDVASIQAINRGEDSSILTIETQLAQSMSVGDSISINGVCLTATRIVSNLITVDVMVQTLKLSNLGRVEVGARVNAELATRVDARLGGHIVQGHVDGVAKIVANEPGEKWQRFAISIPGNLLKYVVNQGSICVDGVSLTVGNVEDSLHEVTMWLIPETLAKTTLGSKSVGDDVNIEVDVLAKYVERLMSARGDKQ
ncbi:MAG: riboflavin synthase [Actinobacteria bacterium]|nr:riboflavin synthase [Actinomycetota bacterium]